ncbi:MAG: hypothetical protein PHC61_16465, partial [Chitinivibrionales bacterium]|nr:hypothetical protein [Chitinivibrionales bacterium]
KYGIVALAAVGSFTMPAHSQTAEQQALRAKINEFDQIAQRLDQYLQNVSSRIDERFAAIESKADDQDRLRLQNAKSKIEDEIARIKADFDKAENKEKADAAEISALLSTGPCSACKDKINALTNGILTLRNKAQEVPAKMALLEQEIRKHIMAAKHAEKAVARTDVALNRATQLVKNTDNQADAFPGLRRAFDLQEKAKEALVAGRMLVALNLTLKARDILGETLQTALDSADIAAIKQRATQYYNHTEAQIKKLSASVDPSKEPRLAKLLADAQEDLNKAKAALDAGQPLKALHNATLAREIADEIARFSHRVENIDDRIGRVETKIEQASDIVQEAAKPMATEVLDKAVEHLNKGKELYADNKENAATVELDVAVKLAAKAVDLAKGTGPVNGVNMAAEIKRTETIVKRAAALAVTAEQKTRIDKAQSLIAEARDKTGAPEACLHLLNQATDIAFAVMAAVHNAADHGKI